MRNLIILALVLLVGIFVGKSNTYTVTSLEKATTTIVASSHIASEESVRCVLPEQKSKINTTSEKSHRVFNMNACRILSARPYHIDDG